MDLLNTFASLFSNFGNLTWQMVVMWGIGALLIYLAIAKKMEPSLLLPMGFGAILVNLPLSGAITQGDTVGPISALFEAGMSNELFPLLLFIGIGALIDFGPLLEKPWLMLFGAAVQFGIFFTLFLVGFFFDLKDAASIAVIGAADGPTAIFLANTALFIGHPDAALLLRGQQPDHGRLHDGHQRHVAVGCHHDGTEVLGVERVGHEKGSVSQLTKILFPIVVTIIAGSILQVKKKKKSVPNVKNVNNSINDKKNALDNAFFLFIAVIIKYYPQRVFRRQTGTKLTAAILQCAVVIAAAGKK